MLNKQILFFVYLLSATIFCNANAASLIRDQEIESFLLGIVAPDQENDLIKIMVVNDSSFNAFVNGGNIVYVHKGLITKIKDYQQLAAVLAHEISHIELGHVARMDEKLNDAKKIMMLTYACTTLLALAKKGEAMDVAAAMLYSGDYMAKANVMNHSRANETAADMGAIGHMVDLGYDPTRFTDLLQEMAAEERHLSVANPYLLTHPLSGERLAYIANYLESRGLASSSPTAPDTQKQQEFIRIKAKLDAFTENIEAMKQKYSDNSCVSRYARSILSHRVGGIKESLEELNKLIAGCYKDDPYIYELQGYFLYHANDLEGSKKSYEKAISKITGSALLIEIELIETLKNSGRESDLNQALEILQNIIAADRYNISAWYLLGEIYYKKNNKPESYIALAEHSLLIDRRDLAKRYISLAKQQEQDLEKHNKLRIREIEHFLQKT